MLEFGWVPGELPWLMANALGIAIAMVLLIRDWRSPPALIFGLYLFFRSASDLSVSLTALSLDAGSRQALLFQQARLYFFGAQIAALLAFAAHYPIRHRLFGKPWFAAVLVLVTLLVWVAIARIEGFVETVALDFSQPAGDVLVQESIGPGFIMLPLLQAIELALAVSLFLAAIRARSAAVRRTVLLLALGFAANVGHYTAGVLLVALDYQAYGALGPWLLAAGVLAPIALVIITAVAVYGRKSEQLTARNLQALALVVVIPFAAGLFGLAWMGGLAWLALPVLATWALLRYSLFDIDLRIKMTVQAGTLASFFLGIYFIVTIGLSEWIIDELDYVFGAIAVGLMLLALRPLQNFAKRLATGAVPGARPLDELRNHERLSLYRDQVELAWQDGTIGTKERSILRNLRERLGIELVVAAHIEEQVTAEVAAA